MTDRFKIAKCAIAVGLATSMNVAAAQPEERKALFGETHLHTSWSMDVFSMGNTINGPDQAYMYAKGEKIKHPLGYDIQITTPLDFIGVTDHSEYVGIMVEGNTPGSAVSKMSDMQPLIKRDDSPEEATRLVQAIFGLWAKPPSKQLNDPKVAHDIWTKNLAIADKYNDPGTFTTLHSYEYSSNINNKNLHRNIFIKPGDKTIYRPFSMLDSAHPEDLWKWMDTQRDNGIELLAISHNANFSSGLMYPTDVDSLGRPIDAAWAESRMRNERLIEIKQTKGSSEVHPLLSPNDEFAQFELVTLGMIGQPETDGKIPQIVSSYARQALKDGVTMEDVKGYNPYKFGFVGASDTHNGAAPYRQKNYFGDLGVFNGTAEKRLEQSSMAGFDARWFGPAGRTGVWAEENTRESIFDALHRKETFATSGPNIKIRFFAGWELDNLNLDGKSWVKEAYDSGVSMGSDLPNSNKDDAPTFVVAATKDPDSGNLDRIQIVKGWTKNGQNFEKVYDVVWSGDRKVDDTTDKVPAIQNTVNVEKATYTNEFGSVELKTTWTDPDFDPNLHAFYYARALEIPTPRWTTLQAVELGVKRPGVVPAIVQERAWASPIWYNPTKDKKADESLTVAKIEKMGGTQVKGKDLETYVKGKALFIRNNVTGTSFKIRYAPEMNSIVMYVGRDELQPNLTGDLELMEYLGITTPYKFKNDQVVTQFGGKEIGLSIYKVKDTYYIARSNEYGFVNYEVLKEPLSSFSEMRESSL